MNHKQYKKLKKELEAKNPKPNWEEEFDKLPIEMGIGCSGNHDKFKSFIRTLLEAQKKKIMEECLEILNHSIGKDDAYKEILKLLRD